MLTTPGWLHVRRGKVSIGIEKKQVIIPDNSLEMSTAVKSAALASTVRTYKCFTTELLCTTC